MTHARISSSDDGVTGVLKWGLTGTEHSYKLGDDAAMMHAYRKSMAEAILGGERFVDEVERSVARELQESIGITFRPRTEMGGFQFDWEQAIYDPREARKDAADTLLVGWFPAGDLADQIAGIVGDTYSPALAVSNTGYPLHLTLLFLSDPDVDGTKPDPNLVAASLMLKTRWMSQLPGCISGLGRFVGPDDTDIIVALVDVPGLDNMRDRLRDQLSYDCAIPYNSPVYTEQHGYCPHITLAWVPKSQPSPAPLTEKIEICIDAVTLSYGAEQQMAFTLGNMDGKLEAGYDYAEPYYAARESYALAKAGRVLSAKNLTALQEAITQLQAVHEAATRTVDTVPDDATGDEQAGTAKARAEFLSAVASATPGAPTLEYLVTKASTEDRFTLGPLYAPMRQDAHGEYTAADTLQKAMWDYMQERFDAGDNRLNLQHGDLGDHQVASLVECMAWPYDHTITVTKADGETEELAMPAGTVYLGAIWDEDAWPLVKSGKLNGWSLGGKAVRVSGGAEAADMPHMGYKLAGRDAPAPAPAPVDKMAEHSYVQQDAGGGVCKVCHMSRGDGNHVAEKAAPAEKGAGEQVAEAVAEVVAAASASQRGLIERVLDTFKSAPQPDLHVHLPEQNVTITETASPLDALLTE